MCFLIHGSGLRKNLLHFFHDASYLNFVSSIHKLYCQWRWLIAEHFDYKKKSYLGITVSAHFYSLPLYLPFAGILRLDIHRNFYFVYFLLLVDSWFLQSWLLTRFLKKCYIIVVLFEDKECFSCFIFAFENDVSFDCKFSF